MDRIDKTITKLIKEGSSFTGEPNSFIGTMRAIYFEGKLDGMKPETRVTYWIEDESVQSGVGAYSSIESAVKDIKRLAKFNRVKGWAEKQKVVAYEAVKCPMCHEWERKDIVEDFGHCLFCEDHQC